MHENIPKEINNPSPLVIASGHYAKRVPKQGEVFIKIKTKKQDMNQASKLVSFNHMCETR